MSLKKCVDSNCQRWIAEEIFDSPTAHALGCSVRRSAAMKLSHAKREKLKARGQKAAATRAANKTAQEVK